ncbi:MAG: cell division FtsA domain-containing protein [Planctomycetaceae bacterium]|nr:cell division FtsA domain-containing protein [Planctomycetaceae bacterium]
MIAAIDFGSCWIRSATRAPEDDSRMRMISERSEYAMLPATDLHRETLRAQQIPFAECEDTLVVIGNHAAATHWLSRVPCTPLFVDGRVPTNDRPARQMIGVLIESMLPLVSDEEAPGLCVMTVPGCRDGVDTAATNELFLSRLVQMRGYETLVVRPSHAAVLATCGDAQFTGMTIVVGAETTDLCVSRLGMPIASAEIPVGCNWVDLELARQYQIQKFDEHGTGYLDLDAVRQWKQYSDIHLRTPVSERERTLVRLFSVVMDRICRSVAGLMKNSQVQSAFASNRIPVILSGGAARTKGFASLLTERFIDHGIAEQIQAIRGADDPDTAVLRGCLVCAELESETLLRNNAA